MKFIEFAKKQFVLVTAVVLAIVTSFIVPPDKTYLDYFDWKTLSCLFSVLAVVNALRNIQFFTRLAHRIVKLFRTTRQCFLALCTITFVGSMFIANDMALLTFLPLGYFVLQSTGNLRYMAFTFIMQNIAANLGGMLTPFGNPQNLYLYTKFMIPTGEFMKIMLIPFLVAITLIFLCGLFVDSSPVRISPSPMRLHPWRQRIYLVLFALSVIIVFRIVPYQLGLIVITGILLVMDRDALKKVDYPLLCTFAAFFVFAGNMARIDCIRELFQFLLGKSTLIFSILSCQVISNVPSAILLSQFTDNYPDLLVGVNIGGTGTLIASLASLITFREYQRLKPNDTKHYLALFTLLNVAFVVILTGIQVLIS